MDPGKGLRKYNPSPGRHNVCTTGMFVLPGPLFLLQGHHCGRLGIPGNNNAAKGIL